MSIVIEGERIDPYFILGVTENDDELQIDKAFRQKIKFLHPDKQLHENKKLNDFNDLIFKRDRGW